MIKRCERNRSMKSDKPGVASCKEVNKREHYKDIESMYSSACGLIGEKRALEATDCWVLLWERSGNQSLCHLAEQGAEVSCKPLTVAMQASYGCVELQHGTHLFRGDGSGAAAIPLFLVLLVRHPLKLKQGTALHIGLLFREP